MKLLKLWRTFKEGMLNFARNGWLSFATISVLSISLYLISVTIVLGIAANLVLKNVQDKINVSIYFNPAVEEKTVLDIKDRLAGFKEIKSVDYVSKETALEEFKQLSGNDPAIAKALEEVGGNPLLSSLVVKAQHPSQYDLIISSINDSNYRQDINRINYQENKTVIDRLTTIIKLVQQVGLTLGLVFVFIGVLITFNAIRLTMYAQKQEFEIKRLVGASNLYIRMPFVFEGIFYGLGSSLIVMLLLLVTSRFVSPITKGSIPQGDMMAFYFDNFLLILAMLVISGSALGVLSSIIAIRRYLKI